MKQSNTETYANILYSCLMNPCTKNSHGIDYELLGVKIKFNPNELIDGASKEYIKHELEWYQSRDLNIKGHEGIETNKVWQSCATDEGKVNSNYGWCIWSEDNYKQFEKACESIIQDNMTKQAVMIYSRPNINEQWNDDIHAHHDMICTIYTSALLREGELQYHVHMRSNDIWFGLRNDLAWQQHVQQQMVRYLRDKNIQCEAGDIIWFADSLHLYSRNYGSARTFLQDKGYLM